MKLFRLATTNVPRVRTAPTRVTTRQTHSDKRPSVWNQKWSKTVAEQAEKLSPATQLKQVFNYIDFWRNSVFPSAELAGMGLRAPLTPAENAAFLFCKAENEAVSKEVEDGVVVTESKDEHPEYITKLIETFKTSTWLCTLTVLYDEKDKHYTFNLGPDPDLEFQQEVCESEDLPPEDQKDEELDELWEDVSEDIRDLHYRIDKKYDSITHKYLPDKKAYLYRRLMIYGKAIEMLKCLKPTNEFDFYYVSPNKFPKDEDREGDIPGHGFCAVHKDGVFVRAVWVPRKLVLQAQGKLDEE